MANLSRFVQTLANGKRVILRNAVTGSLVHDAWYQADTEQVHCRECPNTFCEGCTAAVEEAGALVEFTKLRHVEASPEAAATAPESRPHVPKPKPEAAPETQLTLAAPEPTPEPEAVGNVGQPSLIGPLRDEIGLVPEEVQALTMQQPDPSIVQALGQFNLL